MQIYVFNVAENFSQGLRMILKIIFHYLEWNAAFSHNAIKVSHSLITVLHHVLVINKFISKADALLPIIRMVKSFHPLKVKHFFSSGLRYSYSTGVGMLTICLAHSCSYIRLIQWIGTCIYLEIFSFFNNVLRQSLKKGNPIWSIAVQQSTSVYNIFVWICFLWKLKLSSFQKSNVSHFDPSYGVSQTRARLLVVNFWWIHICIFVRCAFQFHKEKPLT